MNMVAMAGYGQFLSYEMSLLKVPQMRKLFHDKIDNSQKAIIRLNNPSDTLFTVSGDTDINLQLTQLVQNDVDAMQFFVESDSSISESDKYKWLRGINEMLTDFISAYQYRRIKGIMLGELIMAYDTAMHLVIQEQPLAGLLEQNEFEVDNILAGNYALRSSFNTPEAENIMVFKTCQHYPNLTLKLLSAHTHVPYADSLIKAAAYRNPEELFNYAASPDTFGKIIRSVDDPMVKIVSKLANMSSGRFIFPFLNEIYIGRLNIDSINKIIGNENIYYKLLVKTEIDFAGRVLHGDTPYARNVLAQKLKAKAVEIYINEINALHDETNEAIHFKKIDGLTAPELYYLCVLGEEDIYTSSYLGIYKRMFDRLSNVKSDSLLKMVNYDYYRKFIKMAAAYNNLDDFLRRMDKSVAIQLMKTFVNGLDQSNSLEDAVDVADSYGSINDKSIRKLISNEVQNICDGIEQTHSRKAVIYNLLNIIFGSMDSTSKTNLSDSLKISPVYFMPNKLLQDSLGRIVVLQFFYGDKDGDNIFKAFRYQFSNRNWKITEMPEKGEKSEWIEVASTKGTPIIIYANRPLDETKDLDAQAQAHLLNYLSLKNINPTVVIHRGHSYYLNSTIKQLPSSGKVILLGSCGGYHSLNEVLKICPEAQIIASKQVGTGAVNIAMIDLIIETLRQGKDLNWPYIWKTLNNSFDPNDKDRFEDYVPPHKNLGAIFIIAYNKAMGNSN